MDNLDHAEFSIPLERRRSWLKSFLTGFIRLILHVFFRDVEVIGEENIPQKGAVIFVGNHNNQFMDAAVLAARIKGRSPAFIVAAKSMKRRIVGFFGRGMGGIPVERPQDTAKVGPGSVSVLEGEPETVVGHGTLFTQDVSPGGCIFPLESKVDLKVVQVVDDSTIQIKPRPHGSLPIRSEGYKVKRHIDHSHMFHRVWDHLSKGCSIGIFPEGGSHDRTEMLPLKAGVTLMALGAVENHPGLQVKIVPCGLQYFKGHRFRSHMMVEFGTPITIAEGALLDLYRTDRRKACGQLLDDIREGLRGVTLNVPSYTDLRIISLFRQLYTPRGLTLSSDRYRQLTRRIADGYMAFKNHPSATPVINELDLYRQELKGLGLRDHHIAIGDEQLSSLSFLTLSVVKVLVLSVLVILSLPGLALNLPIGALCRTIALRKQDEALARSDVKIRASDVIASFKVLVGMVLVPLFYLLYSVTVALYYCSFLSGVLCFLMLPFFSYLSVVMVEKGFWQLRNLRVLLTMERSKGKLSELIRTRASLQIKIRSLVEELGPQMGKEFWDNRVVLPEEIAAEECDYQEGDQKSAVGSIIPLNDRLFRHTSYSSMKKNSSDSYLSDDDVEPFPDVFSS